MNLYRNYKVAIVTDWMLAPGGADRLLLSITKLFPNSEIFTSIYNPDAYKNGVITFEIKQKVHTTFLQKFPFPYNLHRHYNIFAPMAFESLDLSGFEIIISLSAGPAKGIIPTFNQKHIAIILTPPRALWDKDLNVRSSHFKKLYKVITPWFNSWLRIWDLNSSLRSDKILSISKFIQKKVKRTYGRESEVLYPGLDPWWFNSCLPEEINSIKKSYGEYFLVVSRLYDYKNIDWAIRACLNAKKNLLIVGSGPDKKYLEEVAQNSPNIKFLGNVSDQTVKSLYSGAEALLFCGIEDFGYVPVEAMACGTAVLAYNIGGVTETVVKGRSGNFFDSEEALYKLVQSFKKESYNKSEIIKDAQRFNEENFYTQLLNYIEK